MKRPTPEDLRVDAVVTNYVRFALQETASVDPKSLTRFRADPSKVRVSVRPFGKRWIVKVESRKDPTGNNCHAFCHDPSEGMMRVLKSADHIDGIDLNMQWAYPHPMGASAVKQ